MKKIFYLMLLTMIVSLTSCDAPEAGLKFKIASTTDKSAVTLDYYSVDPGCKITKNYFLCVPINKDVEVVLSCTNYSKEILFTNPPSKGKGTTHNIVNNKLGFTGTASDNKITLKFEPIPLDSVEYYAFNVEAKDDANSTSYFVVERYNAPDGYID